MKKHKCHPLLTALAPPVVHLPIFLLLSLTIRQAAFLATPPAIDLASPGGASAAAAEHAASPAEYAAFANEHVAWLTSLVDPDPSLVIPFGIGLMAFANVEVMQSWRRGVSPSPSPSPAASADTPIKAASTNNPSSPPPPPPTTTTGGTGKIKPNFGRLSPSAKRSSSRARLIQHEHEAGNMSPGEARKRAVDLEAGSMRQRVVGNVMRILAVFTVGIAAEVPAVGVFPPFLGRSG